MTTAQADIGLPIVADPFRREVRCQAGAMLVCPAWVMTLLRVARLIAGTVTAVLTLVNPPNALLRPRFGQLLLLALVGRARGLSYWWVETAGLTVKYLRGIWR
jgi:hypothetical protein